MMSSDKPAENFYAILYDLRHAASGQSEIMINTLKSQLGEILNGKGSLDKFNELIKNNSFTRSYQSSNVMDFILIHESL